MTAEWWDESTARAVERRFRAKIQVNGPDECWPWSGGRHEQGYGIFAFTSRVSRRAHRFMYTVTKGPIPTGLLVCHTCDNPPCVNPRHLWLGTTMDNHLDSVRKGRRAHCKMPDRWAKNKHGAATDR